MEFVLPEAIRRSHIELYKSCPYQFYLESMHGSMHHNNEHEEEEHGSSYAWIGKVLHELFEAACSDELYSKGAMVASWHKEWYNCPPDLFDSEEHKDKMYARAIMCINTFYDVLPTLPREAHTLEKNIVFSIGEGIPNVSITMDRIDDIDGELEILDWKTGKVMVGQKLSTDLQAPLYIFAIREHFKRPVRKFTFHYLNERKTRVFERINDDQYKCTVLKREYIISITEAIREVKSLFSHIVNKNFNIPQDTKKMYFTCKMCAHRDAGRCSGADNESWKQINQERLA